MGRGRVGSGVRILKHCLILRFTYQGKRHTETLHVRPTSSSIAAAVRLMVRVRKGIELGLFDYAATFPNSVIAKKTAIPLFGDYVETWLDTITCEKSTADGYRTTLENLWSPAFIGKRLNEIKHTDVGAVIATKALTVTAKTTNNLLIPLRGLFEAAKADEYITQLPTAKIHNRKHQRPVIDPFDPEEMTLVIAYMKVRLPEVVWAYYEFAFNTGVRPSEQIILRWSNIDWRRRTVTVANALVRFQLKDTKTHTVRDVDLNDRALAALEVMKKHTLMRGPDEPIFADPRGNPWPSERLQREQYFFPTLKALGIRKRPAYNIRHSYATMALMGAVNLAYVARQLGHTNTTTLLRHYAKWIDGADKGAEAAKLNVAFNRSRRTLSD